MELIDGIVDHATAIGALRREIHAHPELNFEEVPTTELVARKLGEWGIPMHRGMATTGVIGIVHGRDGGACGRAVGLRADLDASPMQEHNRFAHASMVPGKVHACGHDGRVAMLLAAAQHFATRRRFDGTVYLIFQPAEEGGGGARVMVEQGLFERFPMEGRRMEQIARHTCTAAEAGCEFEFHRRVPAVVNHQREAEFASRVMAGIVGPQNARAQEPAMASEDFAFMLQAKAGAYCFIGHGDGAHRELGHGGGPCMLHNPSYDFNDELIPLGATYWVRLAEGWLGPAPR